MGATLAPAFAPTLAALHLLARHHYLHFRGVGFSKHRDTPKGPFGNRPVRTDRQRARSRLHEVLYPLRRSLGTRVKPPVAHPPLVQRLFELGLAGESTSPVAAASTRAARSSRLRGREARDVEFFLPLEEPYAPRKGDEDAARLGAGDLTFAPVYVERRVLIHVPEGLLETHRILAAGDGRIDHPLVREPLNPFVDPTLPRRVLPETREIEPPLPVEVPVDDAGGIEVIHRGPRARASATLSSQPRRRFGELFSGLYSPPSVSLAISRAACGSSLHLRSSSRASSV